MKTVMKKIFSLMLVAVLLVSAVPTAFADGESATLYVYKHISGGEGNELIDTTSWSTGSTSADDIADAVYSGTVLSASAIVGDNTFVGGAAFDVVNGDTIALFLEVPAPKPTYDCTICPANGHSDSDHCPDCHEYPCECPRCPECNELEDECKCCEDCDKYPCECPRCPECNELEDECKCCEDCDKYPCECPRCPECNELEDECKCCEDCDKYPCECPEVCEECEEEICVCVTVTFVDAKTDLNTTDTYQVGDKVLMVTPEWVSGYDFQGWTMGDSSTLVEFPYTIPESKAGKSIIFNAKYKKTSSDAKYPLQVYARLYTGDVLTDVVPIHRNPEMLSTDKIMGYLGNPNTKTILENIIAEKYSDYTWNGNFYNARGSHAATNNITTVDGARSVYINLKTEADRVLVYVHTKTSTEKYDRLIELDGYKEDGRKSTVTKTEVKNALKKYYGSDISIKMFDKKGFKDYLNRKDNTESDYVRVSGDVTEVHVRLYKNSSSSSSAKADSTNPKTGDMIFAPAAVLGLSASALAVLFYLNKKRAF